MTIEVENRENKSCPPTQLVTGSNQKVKTALMTDKSARANSKSQLEGRRGGGKHRKWRACGIFSGSNGQQFFPLPFLLPSPPFLLTTLTRRHLQSEKLSVSKLFFLIAGEISY